MSNFYQLLNVLPTASTSEIQSAYAKVRAQLVSSSETDAGALAVQTQSLEEAYTTLSDPSRRAAYDRSLGATAPGVALVIASQPNVITLPQPVVPPQVQQPCPHCGGLNPVQATMCVHCNKQVARPCPTCAQIVILGQTVCPRCNTMMTEYAQQRFAEGLATDKQIQDRREESGVRVETLEIIHRSNAARGVVFWVIVFSACVGITTMTLLAFYYFARINMK